MCIHKSGSGRTECYLFLVALLAVLSSALVSFSMFVVSFPGGDECLLFISVRGEALIYGNPAGCHFMGFGHAIAVLGAAVLMGLLFCTPRKGFVKRPPRETASNRYFGSSV
jgi:hypothetical protein